LVGRAVIPSSRLPKGWKFQHHHVLEIRALNDFLGVSMVPASMMQVSLTGIAYRQIAGQSPTTRLALAYRRGETSRVVRNFITRAVS
jgi:hypothetical protein